MPTGPLPTANMVSLWIANVASALAAASIHTESEEYDWIHEVLSKSFIELATAGKKYVKLDQGLAIVAVKLLTRELLWEYQQRVEEMAVLRRPVGGRQIVWIIINATRSSEADAFITSYDNLKEMTWCGDSMYQIVKFYFEWSRLRRNMAKDVTEETMRNLLFEKMKKQSRQFTTTGAKTNQHQRLLMRTTLSSYSRRASTDG